MPKWLIELFNWIYTHFQFIKDMIVILSSACAICAFVFWKRQSILSKKLDAFLGFYTQFIELYEDLRSLYSPDKLFMMRTTDINTNNDEELKERIHNYRREALEKNRKLWSAINSEETLLKILFNFDLTKLRKLWIDLYVIAANSRNSCPQHLQEYLVLDDGFISNYKQYLANSSEFDEAYDNQVLSDLESLKSEYEKILKSLMPK